jgi:hypothetical protein
VQDAVSQYEFLLDHVPLSDGLLGMVLSNLAQAKIDMGLAEQAVLLMRRFVAWVCLGTASGGVD